ncbi:hypothetical protein [Azorhizobium doebereinerae]|uniref:hypothetical protein n=1 Tax=Azorhizobium doebereinerae TaxID=281091 RepID=UPI00049206AA|nr:hypothetical protein [Azorhizobium doebereinerae]
MDRYELGAALDAIAAPTKPLHWVGGADDGRDWCRDCARAVVRHLRRHDRKNRDDYVLDGGWRREQDSMPTCSGCGAHLSADLTRYGAEEEAAYYLENGLSNTLEGRAVDALYLSEILANLPDGEDRDTLTAMAMTLIPPDGKTEAGR